MDVGNLHSLYPCFSLSMNDMIAWWDVVEKARQQSDKEVAEFFKLSDNNRRFSDSQLQVVSKAALKKREFRKRKREDKFVDSLWS